LRISRAHRSFSFSAVRSVRLVKRLSSICRGTFVFHFLLW
jgi:hypothetical protein